MLDKIKTVLSRCTTACRAVGIITAGEVFTFFHTAFHSDFVTAYLVGSAWIKDRLAKHLDKHEAKAVRRTVHIAPKSEKERAKLILEAQENGWIKGFW